MLKELGGTLAFSLPKPAAGFVADTRVPVAEYAVPSGFVPVDDGLHISLRLTPFQRAVKRLFDICSSLAVLTVLLPFLLVVCIAVLVSSPGPVFHRGVRVGQGGRAFKLLKFRSMCRDAEDWLENDSGLSALHKASGHKLRPEDDPRITPIGRILRRTSIDELPQLWNIVMGHMSVVGARPVVPDELQEYGSLSGIYLSARPGLTGHWQVTGRGVVGFPERAYLDIQNLHDWSLRRDLSLILKTVPAVLSGRGAY